MLMIQLDYWTMQVLIGRVVLDSIGLMDRFWACTQGKFFKTNMHAVMTQNSREQL